MASSVTRSRAKRILILLAALSGVAESCHKFGNDVRLLQGLGELSEPFETTQVGSSAMAYKRNPIRAERMCGLSRRLMTDALNAPLNTATQWLERSLDDSANRRLVLPDAFLTADAVLGVAAHVASGLTVREEAIQTRVRRELPFMVVENLMMEATAGGGDRQELHERLRGLSLEAHAAVQRGEENPLFDLLAADPDFEMDAAAQSVGISAAGSRCARLPPTVPRLRVCTWPTWASASMNSGQRDATTSEVSTSTCRAMAPMTSASPSSWM